MNTYRIREVLAYSKLGKLVATVIRDRRYPNARVHWVQQALADMDFSRVAPKGVAGLPWNTK